MDSKLRLQVLRALVKDRAFLRKAHRDVRPQDFSDRGEALIVEAAVGFYERYQEPIGIMLHSEVEDLAKTQRTFGAEAKAKLKTLLSALDDPKAPQVAVQALVDRVKALRKSSFYDEALDDLLAAHEKGELTADMLGEIVQRAHKDLADETAVAVDYLGDNELESRITRRKLWADGKCPLFLIPELDEKIKALSRGHLGLWLAPPNAGKSPALLHMVRAYAIQGLNVLHITLEDPKDVVENRLDASLTGIPLDRLSKLPNRLRKRWRRAKEGIRGRIRIVDGTDGGFSCAKIEQLWEQEKRNGFTADVISIDYDDELECEKSFKGESARRFEFAEIYRRLRRLAVKLDVIVWTAAQATRKSEGKRVLTMADIAEDYSKARKAFLGISIGSDPKVPNVKLLYVMRHKDGRSRFGVEIVSDFACGMFYDAEATRIHRRSTAARKEQ